MTAEIKIETKTVTVRCGLTTNSVQKYTKLCPYKEREASGAIKIVGYLGCARCKFLDRMDWDNSICHCNHPRAKRRKK